MNKRLLILIASAILVTAGTVSFLVVTNVITLPFIGKSKELEEHLIETDAHIKHDRIGEAKRVIKRALALAKSEKHLLAVLGKSKTISGIEGDYEFFYGVTEKARETLPGNDLIKALYALAASRSGRFEKAIEAAESLPEEYQSITGEIYFRDFTSGSIPAEIENGDISLLIAAEKKENPSEFETIARTFDSEEFWLDAVLLWTKEGDFKRAFSLFQEHLGKERYPLLHYLLAIQIDEYKEAEKALDLMERNTPGEVSLRLRKADLQLRQGSTKKAVAIFASLMEDNPDASEIPYINIAWYLQENDRPQEGEEILLRGIKQFPSSELLILSLMEYYMEEGNSEKARDFLLQVSLDIQSPTLDALKWNLVDAENNPQRLHSLLWELLNDHAYNANIAQFFSWRLIGFGSSNELELLLSRFTSKNGEMEWTHFMRGVYLGTGGFYSKSLKEFEKANERRARYETFFNMGLIAKATGDLDKAVYYFQKCEASLLSKHEQVKRAEDIATMHVALSEVHFQMGNTEKALRHVEQALDIDPEQLNTLIIKKRIQESRNGISE